MVTSIFRTQTGACGRRAVRSVYIVIFVVTFSACLIGKICGIGGGVIIKPVLDALNVFDAETVNVLAGCTVAGMSLWSVSQSWIKRESVIDVRQTTPIAIGAAAGGVLGKQLFAQIVLVISKPDRVGGIQAAVLLFATALTLLYTLHKHQITGRRLNSAGGGIMVGIALGLLGSFLGIGGGPFNMAALYFFFSMKTKTAAQNSLYIILISQVTGLVSLWVGSGWPALPVHLLVFMIGAGILGAIAGGRINERLDEVRATHLFESCMILISGICVYNIYRCFF